MCLWSFDMFKEGREGAIVFKGIDEFINVDCVETKVFGGCMIFL